MKIKYYLSNKKKKRNSQKEQQKKAPKAKKRLLGIEGREEYIGQLAFCQLQKYTLFSNKNSLFQQHKVSTNYPASPLETNTVMRRSALSKAQEACSSLDFAYNSQ